MVIGVAGGHSLRRDGFTQTPCHAVITVQTQQAGRGLRLGAVAPTHTRQAVRRGGGGSRRCVITHTTPPPHTHLLAGAHGRCSHAQGRHLVGLPPADKRGPWGVGRGGAGAGRGGVCGTEHLVVCTHTGQLPVRAQPHGADDGDGRESFSPSQPPRHAASRTSQQPGNQPNRPGRPAPLHTHTHSHTQHPHLAQLQRRRLHVQRPRVHMVESLAHVGWVGAWVDGFMAGVWPAAGGGGVGREAQRGTRGGWWRGAGAVVRERAREAGEGDRRERASGDGGDHRRVLKEDGDHMRVLKECVCASGGERQAQPGRNRARAGGEVGEGVGGGGRPADSRPGQAHTSAQGLPAAAGEGHGWPCTRRAQG